MAWGQKRGIRNPGIKHPREQHRRAGRGMGSNGAEPRKGILAWKITPKPLPVLSCKTRAGDLQRDSCPGSLEMGMRESLLTWELRVTENGSMTFPKCFSNGNTGAFGQRHTKMLGTLHGSLQAGKTARGLGMLHAGKTTDSKSGLDCTYTGNSWRWELLTGGKSQDGLGREGPPRRSSSTGGTPSTIPGCSRLDTSRDGAAQVFWESCAGASNDVADDVSSDDVPSPSRCPPARPRRSRRW